MSGEYRRIVSINQDEHDRLRRSEQELRALRSNLPDMMDRIRHEAANSLRRGLAPLGERQHRFESSLSGLGDQVRRHEQRTLDMLKKQREEFSGALRHLQNDLQGLSKWTASMFDRQREEYRRLLDEQREALQNEIHEIEARVSNLEERERRRLQMAGQWIKDANTLARLIDTETRHQRFAPGELAGCQNNIQAASQNLAADAAQAALTFAQRACMDLSELRVKLEILETECQTERVRALERAKLLLDRLEMNRKVVARDPDGKDVTGVEIEVNYWTNGEMKRLEDAINNLMPDLVNPDTVLTTDDLRQMADRHLPELENKLEQIICDARVAVVSAQQRYDMAQILADTLITQGWVLEGDDCFFEQADQRMATVARLRRMGGTEVAIRVKPLDLRRNELEIHSFDHNIITEHELNTRQHEMCEKLRSSVPVSLEGVGCTGQGPNPQVIRAFEEAIRRQQALP